MAKFCEAYPIPCFMFDVYSRLRPSSFMDIAQELAAKDSELSGVSDRHLKPYNLVWILCRMSVRFQNCPRRSDTVAAQTWHKGLDSIFFSRDYKLLFSSGSTAVAATASWILMDTTSRTAVRSDKLGSIIPLESASADNAIADSAVKLRSPQQWESAAIHPVLYSDLDYNGHVNNAKYVQWACDVLPEEVLSRGIREFDINYEREAHFGEEIELRLSSQPDGFYVTGMSAEDKIFIFRCI